MMPFKLPVIWQTALLLTASNVFMTFAWYAHLKNLSERPWWIAALVSWGIALFEYLLQVPANRIGQTQLSLPQLKIMQEAITLTVFVPFVVYYNEAAAQARLSVGRFVYPWRHLFHLSQPMTTFPPAPFLGKGVTTVQPLCGFHVFDSAPPWGGPAEAP